MFYAAAASLGKMPLVMLLVFPSLRQKSLVFSPKYRMLVK